MVKEVPETLSSNILWKSWIDANRESGIFQNGFVCNDSRKNRVICIHYYGFNFTWRNRRLPSPTQINLSVCPPQNYVEAVPAESQKESAPKLCGGSFPRVSKTIRPKIMWRQFPPNLKKNPPQNYVEAVPVKSQKEYVSKLCGGSYENHYIWIHFEKCLTHDSCQFTIFKEYFTKSVGPGRFSKE